MATLQINGQTMDIGEIDPSTPLLWVLRDTQLSLAIEHPLVDVIRPRKVKGLADEPSAFRAAVRTPLGCAAVASQITSTDKVAVVIPDITRAGSAG